MAASMHSKCFQRFYFNYVLLLKCSRRGNYHIFWAPLSSTSGPLATKDEDEEYDHIAAIRNVSGLKGNLYKRLHSEMPEILNSYQEQLRYQRRLYAKFGSQSDIDPRIMWPSKAQLAEIIEDEKTWEPTLEQTLEIVRNRELEAAKIQRLREEKVEQNMEKMSKWIDEYHQRKQALVDQQKKREDKKAKLLEEAREYFGYQIDPRDKKFKEMLEKKELEEKKLAKKKKKQTKLEELTARLQAMTQES